MGYLVREVDGEKDIAGETAEITRERERERDPSPNSDIFWDIFGPSIGPHTTRPMQPHGDEKTQQQFLARQWACQSMLLKLCPANSRIPRSVMTMYGAKPTW